MDNLTIEEKQDIVRTMRYQYILVNTLDLDIVNAGNGIKALKKQTGHHIEVWSVARYFREWEERKAEYQS